MPSKGRSQIVSYPTPLVGDQIFYETRDISKEKHGGLDYGDSHPDKSKWPHHRVVSFQNLPDQGDSTYVIFYAADRKFEDLYNFEHSKANLGGHKFDTVTRSYIVRREYYDPGTPALGTAMPDTPAGKFDASNFHLISRNQDRISQRSARAEASIGQAELDSLYVVETRTYIDREEIVQSTYDIEVNGTLYTRSNIYIRGEDYDSAVNIEDAVLDNRLWGPTDGGQLNSFQQVSDDIWVVTTQDLIPQSLGTLLSVWNGVIIRIYDTSANYAWPAVMGSDGVPEYTGTDPFETMDWVTQKGGTRNFSRPRYRRTAKRMKTRAVVHQEWLTQAKLDTAEGNGSLDVITDLDPKSFYYPSPLLTVNIPPSLHQGGTVVSDTGSNDPFWAENAGSTRTYPSTTLTDWPEYVTADIDVKPFRGGYLVTRLRIYNPAKTT
jgi:hypothetical protein